MMGQAIVMLGLRYRDDGPNDSDGREGNVVPSAVVYIRN